MAHSYSEKLLSCYQPIMTSYNGPGVPDKDSAERRQAII